MYVTKEQIRKARSVSLADYLLAKYSADVEIVGTSLRLKKNHSVYVKRNIPGYHDFATKEHGNSIDFLTRYKNYSFTDAVNSLCEFDGLPRQTVIPEKLFTLPERAKPPFHRVITYLTGRGIPEETVKYMFQENLLYQDVPYGNAVFVTPEMDYCEIRGTGSKQFHGCRKRRSDRFWYLLNDPKPETAYICEAAIDAVSLMLIHKVQGKTEPAAYVSIGGVANQQTIDRIKKQRNTVLAVDNDPAGEACRQRNSELSSLIPAKKDWNEDLREMAQFKILTGVTKMEAANDVQT